MQPSSIAVYTDGACSRNGRASARAGVGVWWGENDTRNVSEPLPAGSPQTNQRAELSAIIRALETAPNEGILDVRSDSAYAIKCATTYLKSWKRNGWRTAKGGDVKNRDLISRLDSLMEARVGKTIFTKVLGHSNDHGNDEADRLARNAVSRPLTCEQTS